MGISLSFTENEAYYINLQGENIERLKALKPIIEDPKVKKIGHNIKYDLQVLKNYDIEIEGEIFDTMIASYLLNPENRQHNLDALSFSELNWEKISSNDLIPEKEKDFSKVDLEKLAIYSCEDADCTFKLKNVLEERLEKNNLEKIFNKMEVPLIKILAEMERNGILLDLNFLKELSKKMLDFCLLFLYNL